MPTPIHTPNGLAALRRASTAGMGHTARQRIQAAATLANRETAKTASWGRPICCHLSSSISSRLSEIAAAQGIKATRTLKVEDCAVIPAETVWEVTTRRGLRLVQVSGDLVKDGSVMRLVGVVDVGLDNP